MLGTDSLVEAVGIGKGKQDLTGIILDPVRTNPIVPARPEIPAGKACSSLTSEEIIKFLTGDFRLSKAKSNDLFWEAVWPRLLARGWHSEQPKDCVGSKNTLVFLIPGIKKFSRKKLTKGNQYYDSVSDVLNKVASDPRLLVLEGEESKENGGVNDESQWKLGTAGAKMVQNGESDHHRPCYLRPRPPDCHSDFMKFTIVDTSLAQGGAPSKVRELRSLPADATSRYRPDRQEGSNSDSSMEESSSSDTFSSSHGKSNQNPSDGKRVRSNKKGTLIEGVTSSVRDHLVTDHRLSLSENGHDLGGKCCQLSIDKPSIKDTKYQSGQRVRPGEHSSLAAAPKRQRLSSCRFVGSSSCSFSIPRDAQSWEGTEHLQPESLETNKEIAAKDRISQEESNGVVLSLERSQPRTLIDLNLHPQDLDAEGPVDMEAEGIQGDFELKPMASSEAHLQPHDSPRRESNIVFSDEQQNGRRHSTRNRPPTTKALEALACGYLTARKERGVRTSRSSSLSSRSSRRARKNVEASLSAPEVSNLLTPSTSTVEASVGTDQEYYRTMNHAALFDNSHVKTEREEVHELLGVL